MVFAPSYQSKPSSPRLAASALDSGSASQLILCRRLGFAETEAAPCCSVTARTGQNRANHRETPGLDRPTCSPDMTLLLPGESTLRSLRLDRLLTPELGLYRGISAFMRSCLYFVIISHIPNSERTLHRTEQWFIENVSAQNPLFIDVVKKLKGLLLPQRLIAVGAGTHWRWRDRPTVSTRRAAPFQTP